MENTSETVTLSNIHSDICVDSGCTDQKLKLELDQMISKRKRKNKQEFVSDKHTSKSTYVESSSESDNSDSDNDSIDDSVEVLERMKHRTTSSSVSKHLSTSSLARDWKNEKKSSKSSDVSIDIGKKHHKHVEKDTTSKDSEQDHKIAHIDKRYNKISQVTKDTRSDVLRILLILQKLIDDSRAQKQKVAKLEIKIKELEEKVDNQSQQSIHHFKKSSSGTSGTSGTFVSSNNTRESSEHSDFHVQSSTDRDHHAGSFREYELKFDRFKQEVNTEIIKINNALVTSNNNFDDQIASVRSQLATLFGMPKHRAGKCC
jgi:hypothetical protein